MFRSVFFSALFLAAASAAEIATSTSANDGGIGNIIPTEEIAKIRQGLATIFGIPLPLIGTVAKAGTDVGAAVIGSGIGAGRAGLGIADGALGAAGGAANTLLAVLSNVLQLGVGLGTQLASSPSNLGLPGLGVGLQAGASTTTSG